jgi:DNA polymerase/3'-5' exonuclease PolX
MTLAAAQSLAEKIAAEITPFCDRLEIAGSIRRRRAHCGDIDIVCIPKGLVGREGLLARCSRSARRVKEGEQYVVFELANGFQLDLWFAHAGAGDLLTTTPSNWGVLLLARTGSAAHNIYIAERARQQGLHFNPHRGITRRGELIASEEEADIFAALKLDVIRPEDREK